MGRLVIQFALPKLPVSLLKYQKATAIQLMKEA